MDDDDSAELPWWVADPRTVFPLDDDVARPRCAAACAAR